MKLLRSITRRGFNLGTAGWFTVLRPNTWFPASRLPAGFHSPTIRSAGAGSSGDPDHSGTPGGLSIPALSLTVSYPAQSPIRIGFIVLSAITITSALLWWIMHP